MSNRRKQRQPSISPPYRPGPAVRLMGWGTHVAKEQARWMIFFVGVAFIGQVIFVTVPYPDTIYFAVMGGVFMGLAMPGRLWR